MSAPGTVGSLARAALALVVVAVVAAGGWFVFIEYPDTLVELIGVVLVVGLAAGALKVGSSIAQTAVPSYNVAEVAVEGPITRDGGQPSPMRSSVGASADDLVEQIEAADGARGADALLVKLNTPGGEIVPSEDITNAVEAFDGPTIGYATDVCASGGYWIGSACDELWVREGSIVGSIGVIGSRHTATGLAEKLGIEYQQFTAGEYKDAGHPLKEMREAEREYLQGIVDDYYDQFVDRVEQRRDLSGEEIRETEARVYLGDEAIELDLADELGTREAVLERIGEEIGAEPAVREFAPARGIADRFRRGAQSVAYAIGAGVTGALAGDVDGFSFRQ